LPEGLNAKKTNPELNLRAWKKNEQTTSDEDETKSKHPGCKKDERILKSMRPSSLAWTILLRAPGLRGMKPFLSRISG
jgi:hypothetical protein